jgi:hypothetical protein
MLWGGDAGGGRQGIASIKVSISNHKKQNMTTTSPTRRRCVFVVSLLLLTSFPRYSCGQETATIADEAAATAATAGDAIAYDATESVIDLDDAAGGTAAGGDDGTACVVADDDDVGGGETTPDGDAASTTTTTTTTTTEVADDDGSGTAQESQQAGSSPVVQSGPFVDLLGDLLLSLEMIDETKAQVHQHPTNVALDGKKVVGLYFSADW